jgi:hypothetical protein
MTLASIEFLAIAVLLLAVIATNAVIMARLMRHNEHLKGLLSAAQRGGDARDFWNHKCVHCSRRIRDSAKAISEYTTPKGGVVSAIFHSGRTKCYLDFLDYDAKAKAIVASWDSGEGS